MESNVNYPQLANPAYMKHFDLTMTYHLDSEVPMLYFGPAVVQALRTPPAAKMAHAPAVYFASNSADRCGRLDYVRELMRHLKVDSYGRSLRNKMLPEDKGRQTKLETIAGYKFTLAFENSVTQDYVTEKFFDPLTAGSVPVYLGAPNIDDFAPGENCFIKASDFKGPRELAEYLTQLDRDQDRYSAYLAWKKRPIRKRFLELAEMNAIRPGRRLCMKLASSRNERFSPGSRFGRWRHRLRTLLRSL